MADTTVQTTTVPVSNPAHPSHSLWLEILLTALKAAIAIGPAVVAVSSPGNALLAAQLGAIANAGISVIPQEPAS